MRSTTWTSLPPEFPCFSRGKPLPPGVAHSRNLSQPLIRDLPHYQGYEWRQVGLDLVLVAVATELVADVLVGVFE